MLTYKFSLVLGEGLIFGLLAIGIYIAFQWLRFPDLTPDGSFTLGASAYVKAVGLGVHPLLALVISIGAGAISGSCTAAVNKFVGVPTVISGLLVSSALYSTTWLLLGKPNQFLAPNLTLVGDIGGELGAWILVFWLVNLCISAIILLSILSGSLWGLRTRAIGENPLLAHDLGTDETQYTFHCLILANGLVGLAGALFAQRSFSVDINMGIGVTITGLSGMILGLLIAGRKRKIFIILSCILLGAILQKTLVFLTLEAGIPAEAFRLISAGFLVGVFFFVRASEIEFLRGLKWS